jgi:hypothetical protein
MRPAQMLLKLRERQREQPTEKDWRARRAEYLIETGRVEQLEAEGLEHALFGKGHGQRSGAITR